MIDNINKINKKSDDIKNYIRDKYINDVREINEYCRLYDDDLMNFLTIVQLINIYQSDTKLYKETIKYYEYLIEKEEYSELIKDFNINCRDVKIKEIKGSLVVVWPEATKLSNGERDILNFVTLRLLAEKKFKKKNCILIIDEIFDYLDDANLVAFQYYISTMITKLKKMKKNFFPILLTHLDPQFFNHFYFKNKNKLKVSYLGKPSKKVKPNKNYTNLIKNRDIDNKEIKDKIDKHFFHYHPDPKNIEEHSDLLNVDAFFLDSKNFKEKILNEVKKYIYNNDYDSLAIVFATRILTEELFYNKIDDNIKNEFLETNNTRKKLYFCEDNNIEVADKYYLLCTIYNEALHVDASTRELNINHIAIKLENLVIKELLKSVFEEYNKPNLQNSSRT